MARGISASATGSDRCTSALTVYLNLAICQAANFSFSVSVELAVKDYFKSVLKLDPGHQQILVAIIKLPWSLRILYGLISDNVPLCGTRRKSWVVLMGALQFAMLLTVGLTCPEDPMVVTAILFFASLAQAFVACVVDAIMVVQARRDKAFGSQDLSALMFFCMGFFGALGSIYGGLIT